MNTAKQILEPSILTANTYFWNSATSASSRRANEVRNHSIVENFLKELGFEVNLNGDCVTGTLNHEKHGMIVVVFYYSESCKNVYKSLSITRDGKNSNIKLLRNLY